MDKQITIGLLGSGTVGTGVARVLQMNAEDISLRVGADVRIKAALVRDVNKKRKYLENIPLTSNAEDILRDPEVDIVVELMGGLHPSLEYMLEAMENGKHVVTANKDCIAQFGDQLFEASEKNGVELMFEASVGGGIPIITPLKQCLTGNKISEVMGIVNGTTNYMLTKMTNEGVDYDEILKQAQELGYAEANPAADVEGLDAARKAAILASIAFNTRIKLNEVSAEGITHITQNDIIYAKELGYTVKLLAVARDYGEQGINVRVNPVFLESSHPLASVNDAFNAIWVKGNAVGELMFYGHGAGSLPTASAVCADIIAVAKGIVNGSGVASHCSCYKETKICPLDEVESCYYVRLLVKDAPGVLGSYAAAFGQCEVSLKSVVQTRTVRGMAEIVAITHAVKHKNMKHATEVLKALPIVAEISNIIRVV